MTDMGILIYTGNDQYRMESQLHDLLKKYKIDKDHTIYIDADDPKQFNIDAAMMECDSYSLFDEDRKAVILRNPYFLTQGKRKKTGTAKTTKKNKEEEHVLSVLKQYLDQPNDNALLIFYCHDQNYSSVKKGSKLLEKYHIETVHFDEIKERDFPAYASKELKKYGLTLSRQAMNELLGRVRNDTMLLHNSIEKLLLYGKKEYDQNDIRHLVSVNPDTDISTLAARIAKGDLAGSLETIQEMTLGGYTYITLITLLASRFRMFANIRLCHEKGMSNDSIAARMHITSGYVYYLSKDSSMVSSKTVFRWLKELADLDQACKQGKIDPEDGFMTFILKNVKSQSVSYRSL